MKNMNQIKKRPLRILMIAPTPFFSDRGCHVRIFEEVKVLQKLGHKVTICTYHIGKNIEGFNIKRTIKIPWYNKKEAGPSYHKLYLDKLLFMLCYKELMTKKYDIIHAHLHEGVFIAKWLNLLNLGKLLPIVFDAQGSMIKEMQDHGYLKNRALYALFKKVENWCYKKDIIITSSTNAANLIVNEFKIPKKRVIPMCDAVDTEVFYQINKKHPEKLDKIKYEELKLPSKKKIVAYLGVLSDYQGVDTLIKSAKIVLEKRNDVHFVIMGYPDVEKYKNLAKKLGIKDYEITFTGKIDYNRAPDFISIGDIAVSFKKSKSEANGKLYNYMACGIPCIVTDTPVNKEILGELGIYVPVDDHEKSAEEIIRLLDDGKKRKELSKKLREKAVSDYSWMSVGKNIDGLYHRLLKEMKIK